MVLSLWVGRNVTRFDARIFASIAFVLMACGLYVRSLLNSQAAFSDFMLPMILQGMAMAFFFVSVVSIQLDGLPPQRMPAATSISNFLRITAAAFSTSIATTLWDDRAQLHQSRLAEASSAYSPALQQSLARLHELGLNDTQSIAVLNRGLVEQSYLLSTLDYFYMSSFLAAGLVLLVWFTRRPRIASGQPAIAD
jgi:DHA2 family multidrug resistance protein